MRQDNLKNMIKGWFVGDFDQSVLRSKQFEVAVKKYSAGERECLHVHKIATEITVVIYGRVEMNNREFSEGDIITLSPGEPTDFRVLEDCCTVVVKTPSAIGDKFLL